MKLYVVDDYKIYSYSLPAKIEDAYIINYEHYSGEEETITLMAEDNKWVFESTPDIVYYNGVSEIAKGVIENDSIYKIKFSDLSDEIFLYCFDEHQELYDYEITANKFEITVGRAGNFDIQYENQLIGAPELKISKQNNYWILEDNGYEQTRVYLNGRRIKKSLLNLGDTIFTNGLKIIWMDSYIKFNNPSNLVKTSLSPCSEFSNTVQENNYTPIKDTDRSMTLYNDNQVFFHTPRMIQEIRKKVINIENPPVPEATMNETPILLTIGTTSIMGLSSAFTGISAIVRVTSGRATLANSMSEIVLSLTMLIGSVLFPIMIDRYTRKAAKKKEEKRLEVYRNYLSSIKNEIQNEMQNEKMILNTTFVDVDQLKNFILNRSNNVWCRELTDYDFLNLRLGVGNKSPEIALEYSKKGFEIDTDVLEKELDELLNENRVLENVPVCVSLTDNKILPLVISYDYVYREQFINFLLLQLIGYHSGNDLKIVIFTTNNNSDQWSFIKYLPHCANDTRKNRYYAETEDEAKQVSSLLERVFEKRSQRLKKGSSDNNDSEEENVSDDEGLMNDRKNAYLAFDSYYLIITDNYVSAKRYGIIQKMLNTSYNFGFSLITIEPTMQNVPSKCDNIVSINNNSAGVFGRSLNENNKQFSFTPDLLYDDIKTYSKIIGNIPLSSSKNADKLPKSLTFLDMYKVGKIEQLNVLNRWTKNDPTNSISTPIGVRADGKTFEIDLHEKFHGPHGLIAGSTGSGKSEFIITFILSMCVNYHPYEVQFVLIDYKGGGLAGAFENKETGIKIPHLAGTITNLDISEMNRTLVSINSELKRRQRMFNEARDSLNEGTVDIYKYQRFYREGKVKEPMSHLFIISDEFAELKSQQPEFMESLVSTARIGRSLGVHLILATQKPAGVVDDQIWSNSRFKICLKVATAEDSRELLRRPEAAEIKETGRFYLQVGYNELFELGQSGWSGAKYVPAEHIVKNIDDSLDFIDNVGNTIRTINDVKVETQENHGEQLTNIVKMLYDIAVREKIEFKSLWLPSLAPEVHLIDLAKKYNYEAKPYYINPIVGEYDDPEKQFQGQFCIDFVKLGNLMMVGLAGSGKENLIMTILYSICCYHSSEEANIYIIDCGAEILKVLSCMPQVGDVVLSDDADKIKSLFVMIEREMIRRKELFSEYGGSYQSYIENSGQKVPMIFIVLNGWEAFSETYGGYIDIFSHLTRESAKYGIIFIVSVLTPTGMPSVMQQNFGNKAALQLSDKFDYKFLLNARDGLIPKKEFSRGLSFVNDITYEFQGAYISEKDKINDVIKVTADDLATRNNKVNPIPVIPVRVSPDVLAPFITDLSSVPIGYEIHTGNVYQFNFLNQKITQILGNYVVTDTNFLIDFLKTLNLLQETKLKIIDFIGVLDDTSEYEDYATGEFTNAIKSIISNEQSEQKTMIYVFVGFGRLYDKVLDEGIACLFDIFNNAEKFQHSYFVILDNYSALRKIMKEAWYKKLSNNTGMWIGPDIESQTVLKHDTITKGDLNEDFKGIVYSFQNGQYAVLKGIGSVPEEEF